MSKDPKLAPRRLGRGLDSLLSNSELPIEREITPQTPVSMREAPSDPNPGAIATTRDEILVIEIHANPDQPRKQINESTIAELAASLKTTGLIQPVVVKRTQLGYELIAGERRWRAAKVAGLEKIPAIIREVDAISQAQMALVENIQREDLNPIDRAEAYRTVIDKLGLTQAELATRLGEDRSSIANHLRLLNLAEPVRKHLLSGKLSLGHAKLLAGVLDLVRQQSLAETILSQDLSVRNLERLLQEPVPDAETRTQKVLSAHLQDLEKSVSRQLGMRVQVRSGSKGKGRLVIHYASLDQFDDLISRLGITVD